MPDFDQTEIIVRRYLLCGTLGAGGMATVHLGRVVGAAGFGDVVAVKRLHPHHAADPVVSALFLDEARLLSRVQHPNVVPALDVFSTSAESFIVMEYVRGETLARLLRASKTRGERVPPPFVAHVVTGMLRGLHAAHEARSETNEPLSLVHRDVSPQNLIVGTDGVARVVDFGVAKARGRSSTTTDGSIKGKIGYMSPEQLHGDPITRQTDVYAAGVVLWEALTGERLFHGESEAEVVNKAVSMIVRPPSSAAPGLPAIFDEIALRAVAREPGRRYATAAEMANHLERAIEGTTKREIAAWVESLAAEAIAERDARVAAVRRMSIPPALLSGDRRILELSSAASDTAQAVALADDSSSSARRARQAARAQGSSTGDAARSFSRSGSRRAMTMIALGLFGVGAIVWIGTRANAPTTTKGDAAARTTTTTATPPPSTSASTAIAVTASTSAPSPSITLDHSAPQKPVPVPSTASTHKPVGKPGKPAKDPCAPPFYVDAAGHKHFKTECL